MPTLPEGTSTDSLFKAKGLIVVNLVLMMTVVLLKFSEFFFPPEVENWLVTGFFAGIFCLFVFKERGNLTLSGNLLAAFCAAILANIIFQSGGLHARDLSWLIICPLLALFFAGHRSGLTWILGIVGFLFFLLIFKNDFRFGIGKNISDAYSVISHVALYGVLYLIILISKNAQSHSFKQLTEQKDILKTKNVLLEAQNALLEKQKEEIKNKNVELLAIEERLRHTNQELENFAFASSHDLKEPLRMIGMYTQLTKRRIKPLLDESTDEYMTFVTEGVVRLQNMLDSLLQYSRLGRQHDDLQTVDLNDTIFTVVHNLTTVIQENDGVVNAATLPTIEASPFEMTQLFQNLIANALKFRQKDRPPTVEIQFVEHAKVFEFSIADNGIGIPPQYQERVFNIFERLNPRTEFDGSGIGLATCKKIVQSNGGKIWLHSAVGVGTTFFFTLPKSVAN